MCCFITARCTLVQIAVLGLHVVHLSVRPSEQKPIKYFGEKGAWAHVAQIFWEPPVISGTGKATNFKFCVHIYGLTWNKSPLKIAGKVAVGVVRDCRKFSEHPYMGRIARSSLRRLSFLVFFSLIR